MKLFWLLVIGATVACSKDGSKDTASASYGDPIGIRLEDDPKAPSLAVAIAATKGKDLVPAVNALASAFHAAAKSCPDLTPLATSATLRLKLSVDHGKIVAPTMPSDEPVAVCVTKALDGKTILPDTAERMDLLAEFHMDVPRGQ